MLFKLFTISALLYILYHITIKQRLEEGKKEIQEDPIVEDTDYEEIN